MGMVLKNVKIKSLFLCKIPIMGMIPLTKGNKIKGFGKILIMGMIPEALLHTKYGIGKIPIMGMILVSLG